MKNDFKYKYSALNGQFSLPSYCWILLDCVGLGALGFMCCPVGFLALLAAVRHGEAARAHCVGVSSTHCAGASHSHFDLKLVSRLNPDPPSSP